MNMKTKKIKRTAELCLWCLGNGAIGLLLLTLLFAFTVAFCHIFGLETSWANNIL